MKLFRKNKAKELKIEKFFRESSNPIQTPYRPTDRNVSIEESNKNDNVVRETLRLQESESALSSTCLQEFYQAENILTRDSMTDEYPERQDEVFKRKEVTRSAGNVWYSKDDAKDTAAPKPIVKPELLRVPSVTITPDSYGNNTDKVDFEINMPIPSYKDFKKRIKAIEIKNKMAKKARQTKDIVKDTQSISELRNAILGTDSSKCNITNNQDGSKDGCTQSSKNQTDFTHDVCAQNATKPIEPCSRVDSKKYFKLGSIKRTRSKLSILDLQNNMSSFVAHYSPNEKSSAKRKLKKLNETIKYDETVLLKVTKGSPIETQAKLQNLPLSEFLIDTSNDSVIEKANEPVKYIADEPWNEVKALSPLDSRKVQEPELWHSKTSPTPPIDPSTRETNKVKSNLNESCDINLEQWELIDPNDKSLGYKKKSTCHKQFVRFYSDTDIEKLVTDEDITNRIRRNIRGQRDDSVDVGHVPKTPPLFLSMSNRNYPCSSNTTDATLPSHKALTTDHLTASPDEMFDCSTDDDDFTLSSISGSAMFLKKPKKRARQSIETKNTSAYEDSRQTSELKPLDIKSGSLRMKMPDIKNHEIMPDVKKYDFRILESNKTSEIRIANITRMPDISRSSDTRRPDIRMVDPKNQNQQAQECFPEGRHPNACQRDLCEPEPTQADSNLPGLKNASKRPKDDIKRAALPGTGKEPLDNIPPSGQPSEKYWPNRYVDGHTLVINGNFLSRQPFDEREISSKIRSNKSADLVDVFKKLSKAYEQSKNAEDGGAKKTFKICFSSDDKRNDNGFVSIDQILHTLATDGSTNDESISSKMPKTYDTDDTFYKDFCY